MKLARPGGAAWPIPTLACAVQPEARSTFAGGGVSRPGVDPRFATAAVEVRNTAATSVGPGYLWTLRRVYPLLGETLPERQVSDLVAGAAILRREPPTGPLALFGQGVTAPLAIYAAILDPQVAEVVLADPPQSHTDPHTPEFLGILRIGDLPQNLALIYPPRLRSWARFPLLTSGPGRPIRSWAPAIASGSSPTCGSGGLVPGMMPADRCRLERAAAEPRPQEIHARSRAEDTMEHPQEEKP